MKLATFEVNGRVSYGIATETGAVDVGSRLGDQFPDLRSMIAAGQINRLVGSSRVDLQACKLEYSIVSPK